MVTGCYRSMFGDVLGFEWLLFFFWRGGMLDVLGTSGNNAAFLWFYKYFIVVLIILMNMYHLSSSFESYWDILRMIEIYWADSPFKFMEVPQYSPMQCEYDWICGKLAHFAGDPSAGQIDAAPTASVSSGQGACRFQISGPPCRRVLKESYKLILPGYLQDPLIGDVLWGPGWSIIYPFFGGILLAPVRSCGLKMCGINPQQL